MPNLGVRLPDDIFNKVHDTRHRVLHTRKCRECQYMWPTVEVALTQTWEGGTYDSCQVHRHKKGEILDGINIGQVRRGWKWSKALINIVGWGGFYRRRQCPAILSIKPKKTCGARWTTAEVSPDGLVVEDITLCPRCGSAETRVRRQSVQKKLKWA